MTSRTEPEYRTAEDTSRYWLLVHATKIHQMNWDDGERLLGLSTAVLAGVSRPQAFAFQPRGTSSSGAIVTLFLRPDEPIELITEYEHAHGTTQSHWFG